MPALSLVVCVYQQRKLLERLLREASGCYDDLVVVHDGPDVANVREVAGRFQGRFFEHPRTGSLEAQSAFAWGQAAHDWILRLDADEIPSDEMKAWLARFRQAPPPEQGISGYTCIWPVWNGRRAVSRRWPAGRIFLFHRMRVRFIGMVEETPRPEGKYQPLDLMLRHEPPGRKSHSLKNILLRKQAYQWRETIALALLGKPTDLACWRWEDDAWPAGCEEIRRHPIRTALWGLAINSFRGLRGQWRVERRFFPVAAFCGPLHHALFCLKYWQLRRRIGRSVKQADIHVAS